MHKIEMSEHQLCIYLKVPIEMRIFLFIMGFIPLISPYELIIQPNWTEYNLVYYLFMIISIGACLVSLFCIFSATVGFNRSFLFDFKNRFLIYKYDAPVLNLKEIKIPFDQIKAINLVTKQWNDGPDSFSLQINTLFNKDLELGQFHEVADAKKLLLEIKSKI